MFIKDSSNIFKVTESKLLASYFVSNFFLKEFSKIR